MQRLGDSNNRNACSFFFCTASQTTAPYPPGFQGTVVDRLKPLEASRYLPVLFNLSTSLLKALELASVVLSFLKMSPNPAVTFLSTSYSNRS